MTDCTLTYLPVVTAYKNITKLEDRTILLDFHKIYGEVTEHHISGIYDEIWNYFTKFAVPNLDQDIIYTKNGYRPTYFVTRLEQGEHFAPKYWNHATMTEYRLNNPFNPCYKWSKYGNDRPQFKTDEQADLSLKADIHAAQFAYKLLRKTIIGLLINTADNFKKCEAVGASGSEKGLNVELHDIFLKAEGEGHPSYQQGLSLEKSFLCYKDNAPVVCCKADASCKPWIEKVNHFKNTLEAMQEAINLNEFASTKDTLNVYTQNASGDDLTAKLLGWIKEVKKLVKTATTSLTPLFNIGCKWDANKTKCTCTNSSQCCPKYKAFVTAHPKAKLGFYCCQKTGENCHCALNPITAKKEELVLFINPSVMTDLENKQHIFNWQTTDFTTGLAEFVGVSRVFELTDMPDDKILILNQKTICIHPVSGAEEIDSAEYREDKIVNIWHEQKFHLGLRPFTGFTVKKPT